MEGRRRMRKWLYLASAICMAIGVAYGIWAATGVVLTALLAIPLFGERLTWVMGLGIAVIVGGVLLVELGSRSSS